MPRAWRGTCGRIADRLAKGAVPATERSYLKDRLGLLAARCPWVEDPQQRAFLEKRLSELWQQLEERGMNDLGHTIAAPTAAAPARPWAMCLGRADLAASGRLWQVAGVEVCDLPDQVWLRGPAGG